MAKRSIWLVILLAIIMLMSVSCYNSAEDCRPACDKSYIADFNKCINRCINKNWSNKVLECRVQAGSIQEWFACDNGQY